MKCQFCCAEKKNPNSLRNHERLCSHNPVKQQSSWVKYNAAISVGEFEKANSNQYLKAKNEGLEKPITSDETRKILSQKARIRNLAETETTKSKRINTILSKIQSGDWHIGLTKRIFENGVWFDSRWEVAYARHLTENKIAWVRNTAHFGYIFEGKSRRYFPDFYLPDTDEYIEIKGRERPKDQAKWDHFPKDKVLKILRYEDLKELKIL